MRTSRGDKPLTQIGDGIRELRLSEEKMEALRHCRRFTRLTNAHSKTSRHHAAMTALFVAWYSYCRPHMALAKKATPAMAAGLTDSV